MRFENKNLSTTIMVALSITLCGCSSSNGESIKVEAEKTTKQFTEPSDPVKVKIASSKKPKVTIIKKAKSQSQPKDFDSLYKECMKELKQAESKSRSNKRLDQLIHKLNTQADKLDESDPKRADFLIVKGRQLRLWSNITTKEFSEALKIREKAFGSDSLEVQEALNQLAMMQTWRRHYAEATDSLNRSIRIMDKHKGKGAKGLGEALQYCCKKGLGTGGDTRRLLNRALRTMKKYHKDEDPGIAETLHALALVPDANPQVTGSPYEEKKDAPEQINALKQAIKIQKSKGTEGISKLIEMKVSLADLYHKLRRNSEAVNEILIAVSLQEKHKSGDPGALVRTYHKASSYLLRNNQKAEAEKYQLKALSLCEKNPGHNQLALTNALSSVVYFYERSLGQPHKAVPYLEKKEKVDWSRNNRSVSTTAQLAKLYMQVGMYKKAEPTLKKWLAHERKSGREYEAVEPALLLATAQTKLTRYKEAEQNFEFVRTHWENKKYKFLGDSLPKNFLLAYTSYLKQSGQDQKYQLYMARLNKVLEIEKKVCLGCGMG